jgi:hypothetical protein
MNWTWSAPTKLKILDFDIENRPLSYAGADWTTAEITAIAASWTDEDKVDCWLQPDLSVRDMLQFFCVRYREADMVTGHYIRKHDLPILNGALLEHELPMLEPKLTCDTKLDLKKKKDMSASQESLADMYGLPEAKHHMSQPEWRRANRLEQGGIAAARTRVTSDVIQHKALRAKLLEVGALNPPRLWHP